MRVFEEKQRFTQWWIHLLFTAPILAGMTYMSYQWYVLEKSVDKVGTHEYGAQLLLLLLLIATALLVFVLRLTTRIDENGIHYKFFPFHPSEKSISWYDISKCYVRKYRPIQEYGGWGMKYKLGGGEKANTVKDNIGIQLELKNGKKVLFGTQKAEEVQQVIDKYHKP